MNNILILGSRCCEKDGAGGVCGKYLLNEFFNINNASYLLGYSYLNENQDIIIDNSHTYEFKYKKD